MPFPRWLTYAVLFAATSAVVGVIWDISWHRTIGRDTFLTPAHLAIYLSGIVAGLSCGWLVLRTTFGGSAEARAASVSFWGFRGPLGAWLCIWGAIAMITSAPFDDWWHNAYGLDVKVLSPPHAVLALGFTAIQIGALLLAVAQQNRAVLNRANGGDLAPEGDPAGRSRSVGLFVAYGMGVLLCNTYIMGFEYIAFPNEMHKAVFYVICAVVFPLILIATARAARLKWPATTAALVYMAIHILMIWILQLFPGTPKLAPIYNPVTHMVPPPFPILLVFPAFAIDLVLRAMKHQSDWITTPVALLTFVVVLFVVQWPFSTFLISPASETFIFGAQRWNYDSRVGAWANEFWDPDHSGLTVFGALIGVTFSLVLTRVGFWAGNWMARVQR